MFWEVKPNPLVKALKEKGIDPVRMKANEYENIGMKLRLITPEEFNQLPDGAILYSILGERYVKGKDTIYTDDTRGGFMGYGIRVNL